MSLSFVSMCALPSAALHDARLMMTNNSASHTSSLTVLSFERRNQQTTATATTLYEMPIKIKMKKKKRKRILFNSFWN